MYSSIIAISDGDKRLNAEITTIGSSYRVSGKRFKDFCISPTHGGKPTKTIQAFLKTIPPSAFKRANVATFDTRLSMKLVRIFGYAAEKIASSLKSNGWTIIASPAGFFVKGKKGPLKKGELERAAGWAKEIVKSKN